MLDELLAGSEEQRLTDPDIVENARLYHATCLLSVGEPKRAEQALVDALEANPNMVEPNPYDYGDEVLELFLQLRNERSKALKSRREKKLAEARKRERERRRARFSPLPIERDSRAPRPVRPATDQVWWGQRFFWWPLVLRYRAARRWPQQPPSQRATTDRPTSSRSSELAP